MNFFETPAGHTLGSVMHAYFSGMAYGEEVAITLKKESFVQDINEYLKNGYHFCSAIDNMPNDSFCTVILRRP